MPNGLPHGNITPPPGAQLDSAALGEIFQQIQANFDALMVGDDSLQIIRGRVSKAGTVVLGRGYSVGQISTGVYEVTLDRARSSVLTPVATATDLNCLCRITEATGERFQVNCVSLAEAATSTGFNFVV
jgi:hypothetical protein